MRFLAALHWLFAAYGAWALGVRIDRWIVGLQRKHDARRKAQETKMNAERIRKVQERYPIPPRNPFCGLDTCLVRKPHDHVIDFCNRLKENQKKG